jgi:hypothetical protein
LSPDPVTPRLASLVLKRSGDPARYSKFLRKRWRGGPGEPENGGFTVGGVGIWGAHGGTRHRGGNPLPAVFRAQVNP